jgi:hypothetical protein
VGVEEARWDRDDSEPTGVHAFFYGNGNNNNELGTYFFVHKRII